MLPLLITMPLSLLLYMVTYALAYWVGPSCDGLEAEDYAATYWQSVKHMRFSRKQRSLGGTTVRPKRGRPSGY